VFLGSSPLATNHPVLPDSSFFMRQLNIVADGDSWNDYPRILFTNGGLADHLSDIMGVPFVNIAHAGDASEESLGLAKSQRLEKCLPNADILFWSSGGDDIAGDQFKIWLNENTDGDITKAVNWARLNACLDVVMADYEDLLDIRDRIAPGCLLVTHSYDFPPPEVMGQGVLILGPWLKPGLDYCGWTAPDSQATIVRAMLAAFNARLEALNAQHGENWLHVNTQGTCEPGDWGNELHLKDSGWRKVAMKINLALLPRLDEINGHE
jgi:hypothetical protein